MNTDNSTHTGQLFEKSVTGKDILNNVKCWMAFRSAAPAVGLRSLADTLVDAEESHMSAPAPSITLP